MSKDLFLQLRATEVAQLYPSDFTKKEAIKTGEEFADRVINGGEINKHEAVAQLARLAEVIGTALSKIKDSLPEEKYTAFGVEFTPVNGRKMLQYAEDPIYAEMQSKLKAREELLKTAQNNTIYDEEGIEVPKVSVKYSKSSINIKF